MDIEYRYGNNQVWPAIQKDSIANILHENLILQQHRPIKRGVSTAPISHLKHYIIKICFPPKGYKTLIMVKAVTIQPVPSKIRSHK